MDSGCEHSDRHRQEVEIQIHMANILNHVEIDSVTHGKHLKSHRHQFR